MRTMQCPECKRVASIPDHVTRPVCVHSWDGAVPEVWDGSDPPIENAINAAWRTPGPTTWTEMEHVTLKGDEEL